MDFKGKILGMNVDIFFALLILLLLFILGIVSFHFYGYIVSGTSQSALSAGTGVGISLFPNRDNKQQQVMYVPPTDGNNMQ